MNRPHGASFEGPLPDRLISPREGLYPKVVSRAPAAARLRRLALALPAVLLLAAGCEDDKLTDVPTPDGGPGRCRSDADCPERHACNVSVGICYPLDECGPETPCPNSQICREDANGFRKCVFERCEEDADCTALSCSLDLVPTCVAGGCICGEPCSGGCPSGRGCCIPTDTCLDLPPECMGLECPPGEFVSVTSSGAWSRRECSVLGESCRCEQLPALPEGDIGLYSALAHDGRGAVLSAYNLDYGDLMFGLVQEDGSVAWEFVDGLPPTGPVTGRIDGPRGGIATPGPDVGLYTDVAADNAGRPHIVYQDRDRGALKYARLDRTGWSVHTVQGEGVGDTGLYSSLVLDVSGRPVVAYLSAREVNGDRRLSVLRLAVATTSTPTEAGHWRFRDLATVDLTGQPCADRCNTNEVCLASNQACVVPSAESACTPRCGSREACVAGSCQAVRPLPAFRDLPRARGLWPSLALLPDGGALIAYHDRVDRSLRMARIDGDLLGGALTTRVIEGTGAPGGGSDDTGHFPSLYVSPGGQIHLTYMNATRQALIYRVLERSLDTALTEDVEVGLGAGMSPDGLLLGADSALVVDADGVARVAYQDATQGDLKYARRAGVGQWSIITLAGGELPYRGSFGFYTDQILDPARRSPVVSTYRYFLSAPSGPMNGIELFGPP